MIDSDHVWVRKESRVWKLITHSLILKKDHNGSAKVLKLKLKLEHTDWRRGMTTGVSAILVTNTKNITHILKINWLVEVSGFKNTPTA
jgi:hypothetical protein